MSARLTGLARAEVPESPPPHAVSALPRDIAPVTARNRRRLMEDVGSRDLGMVNSRRWAKGRGGV
ncbi:hypothetical protein GCM10023086_53050 [Streptomyces venetus]|uniref:Uncharacterized protein n=1 Tax=Streptomyces venetus TaxID=1701086 RepID=A0ABP8GKL9_9ACTN